MSTMTTTEAPTVGSILESCRQKAAGIADQLDSINPAPKEARSQPAEPAGLLDGLRSLEATLTEIAEIAARIRNQLGSSL